MVSSLRKHNIIVVAFVIQFPVECIWLTHRAWLVLSYDEYGVGRLYLEN